MSNLIEQVIKANYRIGLDENHQLIGKKISFFESIFGVSKKEKIRIAQALIEKKQELSDKLRQLYYSSDENEGTMALLFQKKVKAIVPQKDRQQLNFIEQQSSSWMASLPPATKTRRLNEIMLPGTHDSGSHLLSGVLPEEVKGFWKFLYRLSSLPLISRLIKANTLTQKDDIETQLNKGVRQFDFRLAMGSDGECYLSHTFLCDKLEVELSKINAFLEKNTQEIVIINVKFDYAHRGAFNEDNKNKIANLFNEIMDKKLKLKTSDESSTLPTIDEMQKSGQRVIICCESLKDKGDQFIWQSDEIWPNKTEERDVVPEIEKELLKIKETDHGDSTQLIYASLNTTPDAKTVIIRTLQNKSLIKAGREIQKDCLTTCLEAVTQFNSQPESKNKLSAVMFDSPSKRTARTIIIENHKQADTSNSELLI